MRHIVAFRRLSKWGLFSRPTRKVPAPAPAHRRRGQAARGGTAHMSGSVVVRLVFVSIHGDDAEAPVLPGLLN